MTSQNIDLSSWDILYINGSDGTEISLRFSACKKKVASR
jgi:hypothetical protein